MPAGETPQVLPPQRPVPTGPQTNVDTAALTNFAEQPGVQPKLERQPDQSDFITSVPTQMDPTTVTSAGGAPNLMSPNPTEDL